MRAGDQGTANRCVMVRFTANQRQACDMTHTNHVNGHPVAVGHIAERPSATGRERRWRQGTGRQSHARGSRARQDDNGLVAVHAGVEPADERPICAVQPQDPTPRSAADARIRADRVGDRGRRASATGRQRVVVKRDVRPRAGADRPGPRFRHDGPGAAWATRIAVTATIENSRRRTDSPARRSPAGTRDRAGSWTMRR